jgi:hypothetical protein
MFTQLFAQLPQQGLKGQWKFDDSNNLTKATIGNDLVEDQLIGITPSFKSVAGPTAGDGAVEVALGSYFRCFHDLSPNGADTAKRVNQFTIIIDFKMTAPGIWYAFHATNTDPATDDAESFVNSSGHVGVGSTGYSFDTVSAGQWYRLVITSDLGHFYRYYIDGELVQDGGAQQFDGRFSLSSINESDQVIFFGDNDGDDGTIDCSMISLYDRPMTASEIYSIGGYGHTFSVKTPVAEWLFDKPDSLLQASTGTDLQLSGIQTAVDGSQAGDGAVSLDPGSYYISKPGIYKNGGGNNVNNYSISFDLRVPTLGKTYSLYQTDPGNTDSAEVIIDNNGRIGNPYTGFTSASITAGAWYRVVITVELGKHFVYYLDGDSLHDGGSFPVDGRYSISPANSDGRLLFFAGANGQANGIDIAHLSVYNRALSTLEVKGMGGFTHEVNTENTAAGKSVYLDGSSYNRYINIPHSDDLNFGDNTSFTVEVWVKPNLTVDGDPAIISNKDWQSGGNTGWGLFIHQDDWKFNIADTSRERYDTSQPKINDGNWHYIAAIVDRTNNSYRLITDTLVTVNIPFTNGLKTVDTQYDINIGEDGTGHYSDGYKYPGEVDEVRIWKGVVADPTVLEAWKFKPVTSNHPYYSNLIGYWKFDNTSGLTIQDVSGHNHIANLVNGPLYKVSYAPIADSLVVNTYDLTAVWGGIQQAESGGLTVKGTFPNLLGRIAELKSNKSFVESLESSSDNPFGIFGNNHVTGTTNSGIPSAVQLRTNRVWAFDVTEASITSEVTFDLSGMGQTGAAGDSSNYVLLAGKSTGALSIVNPVAPSVHDGTQITFHNIALTDNNYALGTKNSSASPLGSGTTDVEKGGVPVQYSLQNAYPNPFNPSTTIKFSLAAKSRVTLTIYNVLGQKVETLINADMNQGYHEINWNTYSSHSVLASGVYFYRLTADGNNGQKFVQTKKLMLLK